MALRFLRGGIGQPGRTVTPRRGSHLPWLAFCGLAVALYWPVISIGYLSDDFALVERARQGNLSQFNPIAFRPIPLLLWALIDRIAGSSGVHLFNIVLHGTNGYLTARLVEPWAGGRPWAVLAGSLFVVSSCASEAVAWCSGMFDVLAATLVLTCVLVSRGNSGQSRRLARVLFFLAVKYFSFAAAPLIVVNVAVWLSMLAVLVWAAWQVCEGRVFLMCAIALAHLALSSLSMEMLVITQNVEHSVAYASACECRAMTCQGWFG